MKSPLFLPRAPLIRLGALTTFNIIIFCIPLYQLADFAYNNELFSYIFLCPLVSSYLIWLSKDQIPLNCNPSGWLSLLFGSTGLLVWFASNSLATGTQDWLSCKSAAFVLLLWSSALISLGWNGVKSLAFPLLFLITLIPMPVLVEQGVETFLQHSSANAAGMFFTLTGMTVFREDLVFHLPGISLEVAPECSGIHSSLVLFITSLVAGYLFLKSPWKRLLLTVAVIPLAILRNGFRVWTLGELCVHVDREIINSALHHRGGPIFFALSLIPFSALLYALWRSEQKAAATGKT